MSDSFADLWNATAPSKPAQPTQARTLGSITPAAQPPRKPTYDAFSALAASSSSSTRSNTPSYVSSPPLTKAGSTGSVPLVGGARPVQKANSSGGDAFSDLLSGTITSSSNGANLTIAQRAALVNKQRLGQPTVPQHSSAGSKAVDSAWAGLDTLGASSFSSSRTTSTSPKPPQPQEDWLFDSVPASISKSPASKPQPAQDRDDWGLDDFISKPAPSRPSQTTSQSQSLWDIDEFASSSHVDARGVSPIPQNGRSSTPGSFDFGDREDGLLDDRSGDEDDILGVLSKPIQAKPPKPAVSPAPRVRASPSPQPPSSAPRSRAVSPPPHILGQIVEMGFSIQQARVALAATETGLDVQAALETLLSNGAGANSRPASSQSRRPAEQERGLFRDADASDVEDSHPPPPRIHPRRDRTREPPSRNQQASPDDSQKKIEDRANELLAQASTFGLSMFNRANALWKESKEKVQKAYEERAAAGSLPGSSSVPRQRPDRGDVRPKWAQEAPEPVDEGWHDEHGPSGGFRDDHDAEVLPPHPDEQPRKQRVAEAEETAQPPSREASSRGTRTGDLLGGDDAPKVYVSPFRRKTPGRSQVSIPAESKSVAARTAPSPAPLVQRKCISASPSELATSAKHKATGTEMYKLGRYAEAETAYSYAIAALPDSHLLLVPLYNNRALTRIKTGDHSGAVEDATTVLKLIGSGYHPAREAKVTKEEEGASVDLADAYIKALRRRAEAYEGREKWEAAKADWETLTATDFASKSRSEAAQAASRCRRMLTMNTDGPPMASAPKAAAPPKPKPRPKPTASRPTPPSEALNRVREANKAAEAEDQEKHVLKDAVDAKLLAWKGGKETNLRALIASLDTVLWPELGLQKVGMHELVTPSQVKIRYTKAIAKLHPDKLNVNNTTLEQRMIANGVFGALNEAWNAFKQ